MTHSISVLFVCMSNICRSPTAEGVFTTLVHQHQLQNLIEIDSAGTHGYHVGEAPDTRTQRAAYLRGYDLSQYRARKIAPQDVEYFDIILAMDKTNLNNLQRLSAPVHHKRIHLLMNFARHFTDDEVPDPYYELGHSFDLVIDMIEDATQGLFAHVTEQLANQGKKR